MKRTKALDVAKWFIQQGCDRPSNTFDGNMKLQKMIYFAQLIHITNTGEELFDEPICAYENGSVVEEVRLYYKSDYSMIKVEAQDFIPNFADEQMSTLETTVEIFCDISAKELSSLNHLHLAWKHAFEKSSAWKKITGYYDKDESIISIDSIKQYDLNKIKELLEAHTLVKELDDTCEVVNGITFFYDPNEINITGDILGILQSFQGNEESYSLYLDDGIGLVIS